MFDTMTMTKIGAAFCGALLVFLLGNWAADSLYSMDAGGHGDAEHVQGYHIDTGEAAPADEVVVEVSFADVLAGADAAKGAKVFGKCKACHKLEDGVNATGPSLFAIVGRAIGSSEGFRYSGAVAELGGNWDADALNEFLTSPKAFAPGTKMTFAGLKKIQDRANLIAYLQTIGG